MYKRQTSEALRFVGFCRRNTFSYPTLSREPQFKISRIRMVGTRTGRLIYHCLLYTSFL